MSILQENDTEFLNVDMPAIEGWLNPMAAHLTLRLLRKQTLDGLHGPALEIGVWKGKYLSCLARASKGPIIGIDIFTSGNTEDDVRAAIPQCADRMTLIQADSETLNATALLGFTSGQAYDFISVDGSHMAAPVCHDIEICEQSLSDAGIIALDDFINVTHAIGVLEGAMRYFLTVQGGADLAPFAYCGNKLFLCRKGLHTTYLSIAREVFSVDLQIPAGEWKNGHFLGHEIAVA